MFDGLAMLRSKVSPPWKVRVVIAGKMSGVAAKGVGNSIAKVEEGAVERVAEWETG